MTPEIVTVAIPGSGKTLVLETDAATGRTSARVDGRAVMRPMGATEEEQEFRVGQRRYLLRRLDGGGFDVDITLPDPREAAAPPKDTTSGPGVGTIIAGVLLVVVIGAALLGIRALLRSLGDPIEIMSFTCEPAGRAEFEVVVMLKNVSDDPLDLTGHITLIGMGRSQKVPFEAKVDPAPLPPGAIGRLYIRGHQPASFRIADGDCRLEAFRDAKGKRLAYREAGRE